MAIVFKTHSCRLARTSRKIVKSEKDRYKDGETKAYYNRTLDFETIKKRDDKEQQRNETFKKKILGDTKPLDIDELLKL